MITDRTGFTPTRTAGLARLAASVPQAGRDHAAPGAVRGLDRDASAVALADWAVPWGVRQVVTAYAPVWPVAGRPAEPGRKEDRRAIDLVGVLRALRRPHATQGVFRFCEAVRPG